MKLWTAATPNGWKVSIMLEELREAGVDLPRVDVRTIDLSKGEQFTDEFSAANPNQKIPVLIDGAQNIMESCAILQYLGEKYPSPLLPLEFTTKWDVVQWVYWQAANVGPNFGNKLSYTRYMDDVPVEAKSHPLERFKKESMRLMSVLSTRLTGRTYVCGENLTIADIAIYPWVRSWKWSKVPVIEFPNLMEWIDRVRARPGVARGLGYGVDPAEIDQWSTERKARYAKGGATIAGNENLRTKV